MPASVSRLPYSDVRPLIRSGDVLLTSGSSPMSRIIQSATGSAYSHVGFILRLDSLDRLIVLESVESIGIRACTLGSYVSDYNGTGQAYPGILQIARHRQVNLEETVSLVTFSRTAVDLLGYPYGTRDILNITTRIIAEKLGMSPQPIRSDKAFICSEFCALCFASIGVHIPFNALNYIAPRDFATCVDMTILWEIDTAHG